FALSIAVAFVALPRDGASYWGGTVFDLSRVTGHHHLPGGGPVDQSLRGALIRLFPAIEHMSALWLTACLAVGCLGLLLAVLTARRGNELAGFLLTALTGLLISPVSWTHHWAIVVPAALALMTSATHPGNRRLLTALAVELACASSAIWFAIEGDPAGTRVGAGGLLLTNLYVLAGLGMIAIAAALELQRAVARIRSRGRRAARQQQPLRVIPEPVSGP
ncbi:MAG: DUF2029 domain-containing protein, partial [Acidobacteriota bacterium]|nr:DUF2029 domain-containing protein [Acidobacteriota bacterium]